MTRKTLYADDVKAAIENCFQDGFDYPCDAARQASLAAIDALPAAEPDAGERVAKHDIAPSIRGCRCSVCGAPAAHKVGEESCSVGEFKGPMFADREAVEAYTKTGQTPPCFHNLTNWLCCVCFARVMGPFAAQRCGVEDSDLAASRHSERAE